MIPPRRYLTPRESVPACASRVRVVVVWVVVVRVVVVRVVVVWVRVWVVVVRVRVRVTHLSLLAVEGLYCNEFKKPCVE